MKRIVWAVFEVDNTYNAGYGRFVGVWTNAGAAMEVNDDHAFSVDPIEWVEFEYNGEQAFKTTYESKPLASTMRLYAVVIQIPLRE